VADLLSSSGANAGDLALYAPVLGLWRRRGPPATLWATIPGAVVRRTPASQCSSTSSRAPLPNEVWAPVSIVVLGLVGYVLRSAHSNRASHASRSSD